MEDKNRETDLKALDELFLTVQRYRSSKGFKQLIDFVVKFPFYKPYNAMLVHIQRPGSTFVCEPKRWRRDYGRRVKPEAIPLVILRPRGPVMFIFDISDTEPLPCAPEIPVEVEKPYEVNSGMIGLELEKTIFNAIRDGVEIVTRKEGAQSAGSVEKLSEKPPKILYFPHGKDEKGNPKDWPIPRRYSLQLNETMSREARYATLVHELGHLYCGHLGTPNRNWWPERVHMPDEVEEFEAEALAYLVCKRLGVDTPSEKYLSFFLDKDREIPPISPECVLKAAGLIEEMGKRKMGRRKG